MSTPFAGGLADQSRSLSVVLVADRWSLRTTCVQVRMLSEYLAPDEITVVVERHLFERMPSGATLLALEDVLAGVVHPQAVEPADRGSMIRLVLGGQGDGEPVLFLGHHVQPMRNPKLLVPHLEDCDVVHCYEAWPRSASARFPFATRETPPPPIASDVVLLTAGTIALRTLREEVLGALATVHDRTLATVMQNTAAGLASEDLLALRIEHGHVMSWAPYCRAKSGDDRAADPSFVNTRELERHFDGPADGVTDRKRRVEDHDDFFVLNRVHSIEPLSGFLGVRSAAIDELGPSLSPDAAVHRYHTDIARLRRSLDPFGRRWTDPDGLDFIDWLAERPDPVGPTRAASIVTTAHPDRRHAVEILANRPVDPTALSIVGFNPHQPGLAPVERVADTQESMRGGYLKARLDVRREATRPHVDAVGFHMKSIVGHALPMPLRDPIRRVADRARLRPAAAVVGGRFPLGQRPPQGLNLVGPHRNINGLSSAMQASIDALRAAGVPFDLWDTSDFLPTKTRPPEETVRFQATGDVNLLHLNINEVLPKLALDLRYVLGGHYNIGYWFWETVSMPDAYRQACDLLSEAWCATNFIAEALGRQGMPTQVVGMPYELPVPGEFEPVGHGVKDDVFTVVFAFDCYSSIERKNPLGLVEAFWRAFGKDPDVQLVLKANNLLKFPRFAALLDELAAERGNILTIGSNMSRSALNGLIASADLYASLHRSEGVGLTLLEAMALGTPCMATAYSGNLDFMSSENSFLVPAVETVSKEQQGPYPPGTIWGDPDLDAAADILRSVRAGFPRIEEMIDRAAASSQAFCQPSRFATGICANLDRLGLSAAFPH